MPQVVAKYVEHGREAARSFLLDGVPLRPPKGISYLQIARGYSDLLVVSALYKIEQMLKDSEHPIDPPILLDLLRQLSILQIRVRGKLTKRRTDKPPGPPPIDPNEFRSPVGKSLTESFDKELGIEEGVKPSEEGQEAPIGPSEDAEE